MADLQGGYHVPQVGIRSVPPPRAVDPKPGSAAEANNKQLNAQAEADKAEARRLGLSDKEYAKYKIDRENFLADRQHADEREDKYIAEERARQDTAHTRLFEELKALGINPAAIFGSVSASAGAVVSSSRSDVQGSSFAEASGGKVTVRDFLLIGLLITRILTSFI